MGRALEGRVIPDDARTRRSAIEYVVDINTFRQGKFMPGTGQEIVAPAFLAQYRPDLVIAMNPMYLQGNPAGSRRHRRRLPNWWRSDASRTKLNRSATRRRQSRCPACEGRRDARILRGRAGAGFLQHPLLARGRKRLLFPRARFASASARMRAWSTTSRSTNG